MNQFLNISSLQFCVLRNVCKLNFWPIALHLAKNTRMLNKQLTIIRVVTLGHRTHVENSETLSCQRVSQLLHGLKLWENGLKTEKVGEIL